MYKNLAATLVAACFVVPAFSRTPATAPPKIGFVYVAPVTEAGWLHQHDEARQAVEAALGDQVQTTYVENVAEGADAERVIRDLDSQGHRLIFTPSFGYMEPMLKVGLKVPKPVADEVLARQRDIAAGKLHPFKARSALLDNAGHAVLAAGKTLSDEQILHMNFLVQGVQGALNK